MVAMAAIGPGLEDAVFVLGFEDAMYGWLWP